MNMSRRKFLGLAAGSAALAGSGVGAFVATSGGAPHVPAAEDTPPALPLRRGLRSYPYRSRPDLKPATLATEVAATDTAPGLIFLTPGSGNGYAAGPLVMDEHGETVWFSPSGKRISTNLQVQTYRGEPVLTWFEGTLNPLGYGEGDYVLADASYREITRVKAGGGLAGDLHEFVLTPYGTALFTAYESHSFDMTPIGGARDGILLDGLVQEIDLSSGKVVFQWRASEAVPLTDSYQPLSHDPRQPYDFLHLNSIDVDDDGNLLVSARHAWTIYKVDRSTGKVMWRLGGKDSDFAMGPGTAFSWQHHATHHAGGLLTLFDDGAGTYPVEKQSRGLKLSLDTKARRVELVDQYLPHPSTLANSQGSVQVLGNGNVFVGWGSEPYVSEYGSAGDLRFAAKLSGVTSYRAYRFRWDAQPSELPAIHAERRSRSVVTIYASWNGATRVHRWDVFATPKGGKNTRLASFTRGGFETAMMVASEEAAFSVAAFDKDGRELSRSAVVKV